MSFRFGSARESNRPRGWASSSAKPPLPRSPRAALEPEKGAVAEPAFEASAPSGGGSRERDLHAPHWSLQSRRPQSLFIGRQRFEAPGPLAEDKMVNIPRGLAIRDIADLLQREGAIDQPYVFMGGVIALKARGELRSMASISSPRIPVSADVVDTITEGKVIQHAVTVPEGLTSEQIVARLLENDGLAGQIKEIPREGTLLPETYRFTRGMTREQIIQRMQQAHRRVLQEVWERRMQDLPVKTPEQLVTLASIVERKREYDTNAPEFAVVFVNRLKSRMRLQSDPTIIYGLTSRTGLLDVRFLKSEIEQPTPYNTYVVDGLPPGPIANPGVFT